MVEALAGVAQWVEHRPMTLKVASSVPGQGAFTDCGSGPAVGDMQEASNQCHSCTLMFLSLSLSLSSLSLKINKTLKKKP